MHAGHPSRYGEGRLAGGVAFSKFDPYREQPEENAYGATTKGGARRARILRWVNWIVLVYTAVGFGLIAYWLVANR